MILPKRFAVVAVYCVALASSASAQEGFGSFGSDASDLYGSGFSGPSRPPTWRTTIAVTKQRPPMDWSATVTYLRPSSLAPTLAPPQGAAAIPRRNEKPRESVTGRGHVLEGIASYYWQDQMTASGERFNRAAFTAAHKTLPIGTRVKVTNVVNGRSTIVRINDRGPFKAGRVIDLSEAAARAIDMERMGVAPVKVEVVGRVAGNS